ncbi:MAG: hypothetical protein WDZ80_04320 [Candidatus Paceibacterota bacterium]
MSTISFKISIPAEDGFFGRECNSPECKRYFKIHTDSFKDKMHCPYCGLLFDKNELWTQDQLQYAKDNAVEEGMSYVTSEFDKMLRGVFGSQTRSSRNKFVSVSYKPGAPYRKKLISPPKEKQIDSEIECSQCNAKFQVYGIFGYCPSCKYDNILIYDTNVSIILQEIENASDRNRALRHAYDDLVSTFEDFCKKRNGTNTKYNFQNLDSSNKFFQDIHGTSLFDDLSEDEALTVKKVFQKRHIYQHNKGRVDQKYIGNIPEDSMLLGKSAPLDLDEFKDATKAIRKILLKAVEK